MNSKATHYLLPSTMLVLWTTSICAFIHPLTPSFNSPPPTIRGTSCSQLEASAQSATSNTAKQHILSWPKPMGIIFEEFESNEVRVIGMQDAALQQEVCIRDSLVEIQHEDCRDWPLEQVLDTIGSLTEDPILTFERPMDHATVVTFQSSRMRIAAQPGEHLCNLALETGTPILYECRNGACGTCEQVATLQDGKTRYLRPCVAVVPRTCDELLLEPSTRLAHQ